MKIVPAMREDGRDISTSRWRKTDYCQFYPNAAAVRDLLRYVGFGDITDVRPKKGNPEKRYHKGTRATFIAKRQLD